MGSLLPGKVILLSNHHEDLQGCFLWNLPHEARGRLHLRGVWQARGEKTRRGSTGGKQRLRGGKWKKALKKPRSLVLTLFSTTGWLRLVLPRRMTTWPTSRTTLRRWLSTWKRTTGLARWTLSRRTSMV